MNILIIVHVLIKGNIYIYMCVFLLKLDLMTGILQYLLFIRF